MRLGTATVVYPDDGADPGEIFRDFGRALRDRGQPQRGVARSHRALHRDAVGGSAAERCVQRYSRRVVAIVPLAVAMRRSDRQRAAVADAGIPRGNARGAADHGDVTRPGAAEARYRPLQPRPDYYS